MKVYIAGKITGDSNYREKFDQAAGFLEQQAFVVFNPANNPPGLTNADYMRIDMAMIDSADVVYFLRDWRESAGAQLEHAYCQYIGKRTAYQYVWEGSTDERTDGGGRELPGAAGGGAG